jgi:F1F0 ATPase subunit 2
MTTNEAMSWAFAVVIGCGLGGFFYGGLFWTVRHLVSSPRLGLGLLLSFVLRTTVVLLGFYFVSGRDWVRFLCCVFGFTAARYLVLAKTREPVPRKPGACPEIDHAS